MNILEELSLKALESLLFVLVRITDQVLSSSSALAATISALSFLPSETPWIIPASLEVANVLSVRTSSYDVADRSLFSVMVSLLDLSLEAIESSLSVALEYISGNTTRKC